MALHPRLCRQCTCPRPLATSVRPMHSLICCASLPCAGAGRRVEVHDVHGHRSLMWRMCHWDLRTNVKCSSNKRINVCFTIHCPCHLWCLWIRNHLHRFIQYALMVYTPSVMRNVRSNADMRSNVTVSRLNAMCGVTNRIIGA